MFGTLLSPVVRWVAGILLVLAIVFGIYYKGRLDERKIFNEYKAEVKAVADAQEAKTRQIEAKNKKLTEETRNAYNTKLADLRAYYGMRLTKSGGTLPSVSTTPGGVNDYSPDNLPPTPVLAAQCADETLKLYMLQQYERDKAKNME